MKIDNNRVVKIALLQIANRRPRLKGHPLQVKHKQDWGRRFIFLLPQVAVLPGSDAGSDDVETASSFVIQSCQTSCSLRFLMYGKRWSAVCSAAPHSQFRERARLHLCMDDWNRPTPVRRRLGLTQAVWSKLTPTSLALVLDIWSLNVFSQYFAFHL